MEKSLVVTVIVSPFDGNIEGVQDQDLVAFTKAEFEILLEAIAEAKVGHRDGIERFLRAARPVVVKEVTS